MTNQEQIVILDDDPIIEQIISKIMNTEVLAYPTLEKFKEAIDSLNPTVCFIDVHLEIGISGLDLIPELRKLWPFTPLLVITSDTDDAIVGRALALGANDFIRKPI